jgi:tetratricopeptide (TPR) repeat protein
MAEEEKQDNSEENEIIVEEGEDYTNDKEIEKEEEKKKKKKLFLILIALLMSVIILLLVLLLVLFIKKKKEAQNNIPNEEINKITKKLKQKHIKKSTIDALVKKANILFTKGQHQRALNLLNRLSIFSESLSNYNLGVIQIREKNYKKAIEYFNKAIANKDNRCIAAINAAYCSLKLKDKKRFYFYTHLAELYLPETVDLKGYPYYYALVHYYLGEEFEALSSLNKTISYPKKVAKLKTAIYNLYDDPFHIIDTTKDDFILGISYARIGEYSLAKPHLQKASLAYPLKASVALALVELKLQEYKNASNDLQNAQKQNSVVYPIKVNLKPEIFDLQVAQQKFKNEAFSKDDWINIIFYYAPYKVFDISQTIQFLQKGSLGIALDDIKGANKYLAKSSTISNLNLKMSKGIKEALNYHIVIANKIFAKLAKEYKYHSILHYDLALTYANLKDYKHAYLHFLRAYHLDSKNYLAGIFAIISGEKIGIKQKYLDMISSQLNSDIDFSNPKNKKYLALMSFVRNNYSDSLSFVQSNPKNTKFNLAIELATLYLLNEKTNFNQKATALKMIAPKDVIANLIYFYATHNTDNMKKFALDYQRVFQLSLNKWNLNSVYYGPLIAGELYIKFAKLSGQLEKLRNKLQNEILSTNSDLIPLLKNLAFVELFSGNTEASYTLFNDLIDNKHQTDSKTLFYGAVSSIAAHHNANAIALLALAKAKNKNNYEARYGLGLLYHEAKNLRGATVQYSKIPTGFKSEFFDFEVKP